MENSHKYFKRDISWLSFNYRVLLEAEDETLPIYERIKFLSIYSSNLEEFYEIRVAEHRGVIMKKNFTEESGAEAEETLAEITEEVNRQQREYYRIFSKVLQELNRISTCIRTAGRNRFMRNSCITFSMKRCSLSFRRS